MAGWTPRQDKTRIIFPSEVPLYPLTRYLTYLKIPVCRVHPPDLHPIKAGLSKNFELRLVKEGKG